MKHVEFEEKVTDWGSIIISIMVLFGLCFGLIFAMSVITASYFWMQADIDIPIEFCLAVATINAVLLTILACAFKFDVMPPTKTIKRRVKVTRCDNGKADN